MSSTYSNLGIELIGTGEQAGSWGGTTNNNLDDIIDNAIVGYVKVTLTTAGTSGSPNTLNVAQGPSVVTASDGQKRVIEVYSASDLGGEVYLQITPATFAGYYFIRNSLAGSRSLRIFQGTYSVGNTVLLANGYDAVIRCDGAATPIVSLVLSNIQGTVLNATNTAVTNDAATAVAVYPTWVTANTGNLPQKTTSASLSFVPSTGVLSVTGLVASGNIGLGASPLAGSNFYNSKNITGATSAYANNTVATIQSDVASIAAGYRTVIGTASSVSLNTLYHFVASQGTFSGSTSAQIGFYSDSNLIGSVANYGFLAANTAAVTAGKTAYGFFSNVNTPTGGGAAWGFYANGTANNYFGGNVAIGRATPTVSLDVNGAMALGVPLLINGSTYTVAVTDSSLRFITTACTVDLPAAASFSGRILYLTNVTAIAVTSASSNVIPLGSNTAGTAILAATAGKFAMIQSNGTNWITMMAN